MRALLLPVLALTSAIHVPPAKVERINANTNRVPAGHLSGKVLDVQLEARLGRWYPEADSGSSAIIQAFGEVGKPLQVPGPLIRVRTGTQLSVSIRNRLDSTLIVYGLYTRPGSATDTIQVAPGKTRRVRFDAGAPGTYFYWASTTGTKIEERVDIDSQLSGAIVIDSANAISTPNDRIFVLGVWGVPPDSSGPKPWVDRVQMTINGKSWPLTERFSFNVGDTVRWRWVNPTTDSHPMHLHGFYYRVDSHGSWWADSTYSPDDRRQVVTELVLPGQTMSTQWVPTVAGNWLMHCHFAFHTSHFLSLKAVPDPVDAGSAEAVMEAHRSMAGLILGIKVQDRPGGSPVAGSAAGAPASTDAPRHIRLLVQSARARYDTSLGYGFIPQDVPSVIPADSVPVLSPPLILHRGERTRINIVNTLRAPTSIHWHGIELSDSYYDGVPNWSGMGSRVAPFVAPHDSFTVEITPPRAGTFMYHSHSNELHQIASGMYGALIVLEKGQAFDTTTERVVVIGGNGPDLDHGRINGERRPREQTLVMGRAYRFRIVQIHPDWRVVASLRVDTASSANATSAGNGAERADSASTSEVGLLRWRAVAKDGADLPASQAIMRPARVLMGPGETADFEVKASVPGRMVLEVGSQEKGWRVNMPLRVVAASR